MAPPLQAIPFSFIVLSNLSEGLNVGYQMDWACQLIQKPIPMKFGMIRTPKTWKNGVLL